MRFSEEPFVHGAFKLAAVDRLVGSAAGAGGGVIGVGAGQSVKSSQGIFGGLKFLLERVQPFFRSVPVQRGVSLVVGCAGGDLDAAEVQRIIVVVAAGDEIEDIIAVVGILESGRVALLPHGSVIQDLILSDMELEL